MSPAPHVPPAEGSLSERDLPDLVLELSRLRWTGMLVLQRMGIEVRLNLKDGGMGFGSPSAPDRRLGNQLFRSGSVTLRQLVNAGQAVAPGKRLGTILVEQGVLAPKALVRAVVDQTQEIIYAAFQWTDGRYRLQEGAEASESITLNISTPSIILEGIRRIESWTRIDRAVGGAPRRPPPPAPQTPRPPAPCGTWRSTPTASRSSRRWPSPRPSRRSARAPRCRTSWCAAR